MKAPNKKTRSFRCSEPLWEIVEAKAQEQDKKPSELIIEALAAHVGEVIRKDKQLTASQVTALVSKVNKLEDELKKVKEIIN